MKGFVIALIILGVWLAHKRGALSLDGKTSTKPKPRPRSIISTLSPGFGSGVNSAVSTSGSSTPGSGVPSTQPALASSWSIGGAYNIGNVGVTYRKVKGNR